MMAVGLAVALTLLIHLLAGGFIHASGIIYQYVQRDGTVVYTDQWDQIPAAYRDKVRSLDGDTLEPIVSTAAAARAVTPPVPHVRGASRPVPPEESWGVMAQYLGPVFERMQAMNLSLPSHTQLGIALTLFAFIAATFSILRMTENRLARAAIKAVLILMIAGSVYAVFLNDLAETLITESTAPAPRTAPRSTTARTGSSQPGLPSRNPLSSLTQTIRDSHNTSVEKAKQAVDAMNRANQQLESTIAGFEPETNVQETQLPSDAGAPPATDTTVKPQSQSRRPAHEALVHRVRDAGGRIDQIYRDIESTAAAIETEQTTSSSASH
jgi:hypothetical protein